MPKWYKLDSVGKYYASISTVNIPKVFRYSAQVRDDIDEATLQLALKETIDLYPHFHVTLKKGLFWYYLNETKKKIRVREENLPVCYKIYGNSDDILYRVSYFNNKINFEISHILSDGRGAVEFFKVLVSNYIKLKYDLKKFNIITENSEDEKAEDSFSKYYKRSKIKGDFVPRSYLYKNKKMKNQTRFLECHMNVSDVLDLAHKYKASLSSFIVSVLIYSFKDTLTVRDLNKTIKIDIPVDLRSFFKSSSSKNFFGVASVNYTFESTDDSLEKIIKSVNKQFKENITKEKLGNKVNSMLGFERSVFLRFLPLPIKNLILKEVDDKALNKCSTNFSNVGIIDLPNEISKYVESISVITSTEDFQFTACSFKNDLVIGISSRYKTNDVIKNFCRYFSKQDIKVSINASEVK